MISTIQQTILRRLADVCELSDDIRIGQLVAFLPLLTPGEPPPSLGNIEDKELLQALETLHGDLLARKATAQEVQA